MQQKDDICLTHLLAKYKGIYMPFTINSSIVTKERGLIKWIWQGSGVAHKVIVDIS